MTTVINEWNKQNKTKQNEKKKRTLQETNDEMCAPKTEE